MNKLEREREDVNGVILSYVVSRIPRGIVIHPCGRRQDVRAAESRSRSSCSCQRCNYAVADRQIIRGISRYVNPPPEITEDSDVTVAQ